MSFPGRSFILIILISLGLGCNQVNRPVSKIPADLPPVIISPYGQDLFSLNPMNLGKGLDSLIPEYRFFLGDELDTLKILQIRDFIIDPLNRKLAEDCQAKYNDITFLEKGLANLFFYSRAEIPGFTDPAVYTYVSGLLYELPVQYLDSVMIIGLDMFLGKNYEPYRAIGLPMYITRRMESYSIIPECARQISQSMIPSGTDPKTLLDHMVLDGKVLYAMDKLLPETSDSLKIGYTSAQYSWCSDNEKSLWRLIIDQELLYSSDPTVIRKLMQDGPFTAGMPDGAPAMLGKWIGWQIVRSYMKKHDEVTLSQLFEMPDSQSILLKSGYKPKK